MPTSQNQPLASHKRTSSAAGNSTSELPEIKKTAIVAPNTVPFSTPKPLPVKKRVPGQFVYIVMVDSQEQYSPGVSDVPDIYATIEDANNAVRRISGDEYSGTEESEHGTNANGTVWWSTDDAGEGERVRVFVKVCEVKPPGSEPECEWGSGSQDTDEEENFKDV